MQVYTKTLVYRTEPVSLTELKSGPVEPFARQLSLLTFTNGVGGRNGTEKQDQHTGTCMKREIKGSPKFPPQEPAMGKSGGIRLNNRGCLAEAIVKDCNGAHRRSVGSLPYIFSTDVGSVSYHDPPALPNLSS